MDHLPLKLIIIRHGVTDMNQQRIYQPDDSQLNPFGIEQVRATKNWLISTDQQINFTISSPAIRCTQTAEILMGKEAFIDTNPLLAERHQGIGIGKPVLSFEDWHQIAGGFAGRKLEGGESWADVSHRARKFVVEEITPYILSRPQQTILIVSHRGWIKSFLSVITGIPLQQAISNFDVPNASVSIVQPDRRGTEGWRVVSWGQDVSS